MKTPVFAAFALLCASSLVSNAGCADPIEAAPPATPTAVAHAPQPRVINDEEDGATWRPELDAESLKYQQPDAQRAD